MKRQKKRDQQWWLYIPLWLLAVLLTTACSHDESGAADTPAPEVIAVSGQVLVDGVPVDDPTLTVNSFLDDSAPAANGTFSRQMVNNNIPQLLYVDDKDGNTLMMARKYFDPGQQTKVDEESTALALLTMHPLFIRVNKDNFSVLEEKFKACAAYSDFLSEVKKLITERKSLFDESNEELKIKLNNVIEELCASQESAVQAMAVRTKDTGKSTRASVITQLDQTPFSTAINGTELTFWNKGWSPPYELEILHGTSVWKTGLMLKSANSYGMLDFIMNGGHLEFDKVESDPLVVNMVNEGQYGFYFDRTTPRAKNMYSMYLLTDALSIFGFDDKIINDEFLKNATEFTLMVEQLIADPNTSIIDVVKEMSGFFGKLMFEKGWNMVLNGQSYNVKEMGKKLGTLVGKLTLAYGGIKGAGNEIARIIWGLNAPYQVQANVCQYNNVLTNCTRATIRVHEGDAQQGFGGQRLMLPISVAVYPMDEYGMPQESTTFQRVKFEVISGGGSVENTMARTENGSNVASTYWTIGTEGIQKVKAVAVDVISGAEISEPVYFTATIRQPADLTIRLDWNKLSGHTDIDLHTTDPSGEEIAYYHMTSASGGWLDRDDVVGPGPEHICWTKAPSGQYLVQVHYYGSDTGEMTSYAVTINAGGRTYGPYTGTIAYHQLVTIGTVTMPGGTVSRAGAPVFTPSRHVKENVQMPAKR